MKTVFLRSLLCCVLVLAIAHAAFAAGTPDEAKAMVEKAKAYVKANGKDKAIAAFNDTKGEFVKGDLYIFFYDFKGNAWAHGGNPKLVGKNLWDVRDADGQFLVQMMIEAAKKGAGWVDYKWSNPETKKVQAKTTYVSKVDGMDAFVACGAYK